MQFAGINLSSSINPYQSDLNKIMTLQQYASDNIANVNTPGYRPKRYDFKSFLTEDNGVMKTGLSGTMGESQLKDVMMGHEAGGKVVLQDELMAMHKNMLYFQMISRSINTKIKNLRAASQVGR